MKLRINRQDVCEVNQPRMDKKEKIEFLVPAEWNRVPPGKAEIIDEAGRARPVKLSAQRVGFRETWVTATFLDQKAEGGAR